MEAQANEQMRVGTHTAGAEKGILGVSPNDISLGKFKDVKSLLDAYNCLQAEFTRRCKRVKELEGLLQKDNGTDSVARKQENVGEKADGKLEPNDQKSAEQGLSAKGDAIKDGGNFRGAFDSEVVNTKLMQQTVNDQGGCATNPNELQKAENIVSPTVVDGNLTPPTIDEEQLFKRLLEKMQTQAKFVNGVGVAERPKTTPHSIKDAGRLASDLFKRKI